MVERIFKASSHEVSLTEAGETPFIERPLQILDSQGKVEDEAVADCSVGGAPAFFRCSRDVQCQGR